MQMRHKFEAAGGKVLEKTMAQGVRIHPDGVALQLQSDQTDVTGQLLIDCMGNFSPIVRQVLYPSYCDTLHAVPAVVCATPGHSEVQMSEVVIPVHVCRAASAKTCIACS